MKLLSIVVVTNLLGHTAATVNRNGQLQARHDECEGECCQYPDSDFDGWDRGNNHEWHGPVIYVKAGDKIQDALDSASVGTQVVVEEGTYSEQLTIITDGIQLIGRGAILIPPPSPVKNTCSGVSGPDTEVGICVTGTGVELAPYVNEHQQFLSVKEPVKHVKVTDFDVRGFSGINILVLGAENAHIASNKLADAPKYGALTLGSVDTLFEENEVTSSAFGAIAICMDNRSGVLVTKNHVSNHFVGLCVQTNEADVRHNHAEACCFGVFVDPGVNGAKIRHNRVGATNPACAEFGINAGISLDGAVNAKVLDNFVQDQRLDSKGAGIAIVDDPCNMPPLSLKCLLLGGSVAVSSGNVVLRNTLENNDVNIYLNTTGTDNLVACN